MTSYADRLALAAPATEQETVAAAWNAAALIEAKGKASYAFVDNLGRICAFEALKRTTAKVAVRQAVLRALTAQNHRNIIDWNDSSTQEEVVKGFLQVADRIEARP